MFVLLVPVPVTWHASSMDLPRRPSAVKKWMKAMNSATHLSHLANISSLLSMVTSVSPEVHTNQLSQVSHTIDENNKVT